MITQESILRYLNSDSWFTPNRSLTQVEITNENGERILVAQSYYHHLSNNSGQIEIRVSDHGTFLNTWIRRQYDPSKSLQNLSAVFSNGPVKSIRKTEPIRGVDASGKEIEQYRYFVVEQYVYKLDNLSEKDFKKVINQIKRLEQEGVFNDPLRKKPSKRANRSVLTPTDQTNQPIPPTTNAVNPRQTIVGINKDHEVDKDGKVISDSRRRRRVIEGRTMYPQRIRLTESQLMYALTECTKRVLKEDFYYEKTSYKAKPKNKGRLNDWEITQILQNVIFKMVREKQICSEDGMMLLHYGLYNNDCYGHSSEISHK